jgi:hypothetical protein
MYKVVLKEDDYANYTTAKGPAGKAASESREALEADCRTDREEPFPVPKLVGTFFSRGSRSNLGLFNDGTLMSGTCDGV